MNYVVVTEHWPRNPSKPMHFKVESRNQQSIVSADTWRSCIEADYKRQGKKKSKRLKDTYIVMVLSPEDVRRLVNEEVAENRKRMGIT